MKNATRLSILMCCMSAGFAGCREDDELSCITDSDCAASQTCEAGLCVRKTPSTPNRPGNPNKPRECYTADDCPDAVNYNCTSYGTCEAKPCYTDTDCQNRNGKDWFCTAQKLCQQKAKETAPQLTFSLRLSAKTALGLSTLWAAYLDPAKQKQENAVILMLCHPDDSQCRNPVLTRELTADDGYTQDLQISYGPTVRLHALPEGNYKLMIVADSLVSAKAGQSWKDKNDASPDWGGIVSDTDLLLSDGDDTSAPAPVDVTIQNGTTADLGTLTLGYFFQHDISPHPQAEQGTLAVAVSTGLRFIALNGYVNIPTTEGGKKFDFIPIDAKGNAVTTDVCSLAKGYDADGRQTVVWLVMCDGSAYPFDVQTRKQIGSHAVISGSPAPKMAFAHHYNGKNFLFIQNYPGPEAGGLTENNYKGLWGAEVSDVLNDTGDAVAGSYDTVDDNGLLKKFGAYHLAAYKDTLFVQIYHTSQLATNTALQCGNDHICVYQYKLLENGTLIPYKTERDTVIAHIDAGARLQSITSDEGEKLTCDVATKTMQPKIAVASNNDKAYLLIPRCLDTKVYAIDDTRASTPYDPNDVNNDALQNPPVSDDSEIDCNPNEPGKQPLNHAIYGQMLGAFAPSPDNKILWAVPNNKSLYMLHAYLNSNGSRVTHNRLSAFPIDISGDYPAPASGWNDVDIDNFSGLSENDPLSKFITPQNDPGLDLTAFYMKQHVLNFYPSANGALSSLVFNGAKIAAGKHTLWLIGHAHADGKSSVGVFGDIAMFDTDAQKAVLNDKLADWYKIFTYGGGAGQVFGFHLSKTQDIVPLAIEYFNPDET